MGQDLVDDGALSDGSNDAGAASTALAVQNVERSPGSVPAEMACAFLASAVALKKAAASWPVLFIGASWRTLSPAR